MLTRNKKLIIYKIDVNYVSLLYWHLWTSSISTSQYVFHEMVHPCQRQWTELWLHTKNQISQSLFVVVLFCFWFLIGIHQGFIVKTGAIKSKTTLSFIFKIDFFENLYWVKLRTRRNSPKMLWITFWGLNVFRKLNWGLCKTLCLFFGCTLPKSRILLPATL